MRGPSASLGSAAVSLTTQLLFLPPSVLAIYIFELGLKERILEVHRSHHTTHTTRTIAHDTTHA
jgi:hypothetical protein